MCEFFAAGDNTYGQLWNPKYKLCPIFVQCTSFPLKPSEEITQISIFNQTLAVLINKSKVLFKHEDQEIIYFNGSFTSIACLDNTVFALTDDGKIINLTTKECYDSSKFVSFAVSPTYIVAIDEDHNAILLNQDSEPSKIAEDAIVVGCTTDIIFIATSESLLKYEDGEITSIKSNQIAAIACSEDDVLFLDTEGTVWKYELNNLIQMYALPPIVSISLGPQHAAALSVDGRLYTWGFNPSGQLGIGTDLPTNYPSMVIENVIQVACGTHHTLALCSKTKRPLIPEHMKTNQKIFENFTRPSTKTVGKITRAELLF
ncbi:alpha-tubulin suppressor-like RCC1 family protein [Histomonas meleagridis]|uniref:alpha-tubulin suppressor-like RCC1 family protein n=1 Tax=Histomonas meleagridis TaxID=135588 RepID=UPI0035596863|nr:alpha-tubulin suppressor-like RCC1 family protein [Histomonas meleagridis]KAH0807106.1 alpha-tubulin suppressor-like RCC1 family protein [Histomonas meleagridis]